MRPEALLAIRSDIAPDIEPEYLDWLTKEHTIERVGIEGFVSARVLRRDGNGIRRYLILYELANAAVVDSPAYLARLNNPTPWSARMMPHLGNFVRGGGEVVRRLGTGDGVAVLPVVIQTHSFPLNWERLEGLSQSSQVVSVRLLQADAGRTSVPTRERSIRSGDSTFSALLLIDALDRTALVGTVKELYPALAEAASHMEGEDMVYSNLFSLSQSGIDGAGCP